jgi:hypothetical protein
MEGEVYSREFAGIVPRSVNAILEHLEASTADYTIRVSFLELCKYATNSTESLKIILRFSTTQWKSLLMLR